MTGMELLKEELLRRGCTKAQVEAKVIPVVVDILAKTGTKFTDIDEETRRLERVRYAADLAVMRAQRTASEREEQVRELAGMRKEIVDYVRDFETALGNCESPEGRDRLRAAQLFIQAVTIDTKYDRTAFIVGLSAILSGGAIAPLAELKKLNPKLPIYLERGDSP